MRSLKLLYCLIAFTCILVTTYLFGYDLLEGSLKGNDIGAVLTGTTWLNEWFPRIPRWYPLQNAGVSIVEGIYVGAYYLVIFLKSITPLSLIQSLRLISFLSVFLTAAGIYLFVSFKFKNQTMALLSSIFYPLSQAVWSWITDIGIFAQSVSFIFVMPTLLFFDLYLTQKRKIALLGAVMGLGLSFLTHIITGIVLLGVLFLYALCHSNFRLAIFDFVKVGILTIALISFWFLPFLRYGTVASRSGTRALSAEQIPYIQIPIFLGIEGPNDFNPGNDMWYAFMATPVLILAAMGILFSLFRRERLVISLSLLAIFFLFFSALPGLSLFLVKNFMLGFLSSIYPRTFFVVMIIIPILAGYGCLTLSKLVVSLFKKYLPYTITAVVLTAFLTLSFAGLSLFFFSYVPRGYETVSCYRGYGLGRNTAINYCQFWQKLKDIKPISGQGTPWENSVKNLKEELSLPPTSRLDFSPNHLGGIMSNWSTYSDTPLLSLYWYPISLNDTLWAYQQSTFYGKKTLATEKELENLAKWFGINYVILNKNLDPQEIYREEKWESLKLGNGFILPIEAKSLREPISLVTWTKKPTVLFIGRHDKRAYEQFFRIACAGAAEYNQAILIQGKDSGVIDDYSLAELKKFDIVFLYGYTYKDRTRAWKLIDQYVKEGGRLFIETGWQYVSPDWEWETPAQVLPVKKLTWRRFSDWSFPGFSPPEYKGAPWGASVGELTDLKDWATPVLLEKDKVLAAYGNYGRGKIVWSGMNLIGHSFTYKNESEYVFLSNLLDWLSVDLPKEDLMGVEIIRDYPDRVEFVLNQSQEEVTSLYWREAYFPDWKARIGSRELKVYRAGPNMMLVRIPPEKEGVEVVLELKYSVVHTISWILTFFTLLLLIIWIFKEKWLTNFYQKFAGHLILRSVKKWWEKEGE